MSRICVPSDVRLQERSRLEPQLGRLPSLGFVGCGDTRLSLGSEEMGLRLNPRSDD